MSLPLREYLAQRRTDVQASIRALRAELAEIDAAERALQEVSGEPRSRRERGTSGSGKKTLKELAMEVLEDFPFGLEATGILEQIKNRHGIEIRRESMSPQLSRLGQDGTLAREGLLWKLAKYARTQPPSDPFADAVGNDETPTGYQPAGASSEDDLSDLLG